MSSVATANTAKKLKRFGKLSGGTGFPVDEQGYSRDEMEIPFFKVKDLGNAERLTETSNYISYETACRLGAEIFPAATIVFAKVGAALLLNRFRILGVDGCIDNNMMALTLSATNDVGYFTHLLNATDISVNFNQGPVPSVNTRQVGDLQVFVPLLDEQKRVATYLDASCRTINAAVMAKQEQIEKLSELKRRFLHEVFNNDKWPRERLKDVLTKIGSGVTPDGGAATYLDSGIPLLRSQNIHFDGLRLNDVAFISTETHAEMSNSQVKPLDVLVNITGASIGRCTFVPEGFGEANVNQHVCILRPSHRIDSRFLGSYLTSPFGQGDIFSGFTGASRQGLTHTDLGIISVPLPPLEVQQETMVRMDSKLSQLTLTTDIIAKQIDTLTAYRKSLIHQCVTGQRRIIDEDVNRVTAHAASLA